MIVIGAIVCAAIAIGFLFFAGALEQNLLGSAAQRKRAGSPPRLELEALIGLIVLAIIGAGLLWTGIGSCLARRWVRPIVVIASVIVLLACLLGIVANLLLLPALLARVDEALVRRSQGPTSGTVLTVVGIRMAIIFGVGVLLPWLMYRFYLGDKTRRALDVLDQRRLWTDRCPLPVLGWSAFVALMSVLLLLALVSPNLPAFVVVLTGAPAIIAITILAIGLLWSASLCYRLDRLGWIVSFVLLLLMRASTAVLYWSGSGSQTDGGSPAMTIWGRQAAEIAGDWLPAVMASLEALVVLGFGLYVAKFFAQEYRTGIIRAR